MWFNVKQANRLKVIKEAMFSKDYSTVINRCREMMSKLGKKGKSYFEVSLIFSAAQFRIGNGAVALRKLEDDLRLLSNDRGKNKKLLEDYSLLITHFTYLLDGSKTLQRELHPQITVFDNIHTFLLQADKANLEQKLPVLEEKLEDTWKYFNRSGILLLLHKGYSMLGSSKSDVYYQQLVKDINYHEGFDFEDYKIYQELIVSAEVQSDFSTALKCSEIIAKYLEKYSKSRQEVCDWYLAASKYALLCDRKSMSERYLSQAAKFLEKKEFSIFELFADKLCQSIRLDSEPSLLLAFCASAFQVSFDSYGLDNKLDDQLRVVQKHITVLERIVDQRLIDNNLNTYIVNGDVDEESLEHLLETTSLLFKIGSFVDFIEKNSNISYKRDFVSEGRRIWSKILDKDFPKITQQLQLSSESYEERFFLKKEDYERAAFINHLVNHKRDLYQTFLNSISQSNIIAEDYVMMYSGVQLISLLSNALEAGEPNFDCLTPRAWDYFRNGDFVKAKYLFEYWFRYKVRKVGIFHESNLFNLKGLLRTSRRLGQFQQAICYGVQRMVLAKQIQNYWDLNESCTLLAEVYMELGDYDKARQALYDGASFNYSTGGIALGNNWSNETFALLEIAAGNFESALPLINFQLEHSELEDRVQHHAGFLGRSYAVLGRFYNAQGQYKQALDSFKKSFENYSVRNKDTASDLERLYTHLIATFINLGDNQDLAYALEMIHHALNYVLNRCVSAFEILDEDSRYHYLRVCRHILSLCHTFVVQHPYTFTSQEMVHLSLIMKNICNEATYFHINQLEDLSDEYRDIYNEWLELRNQELIDYPHWSPNVLLTKEGNRKFELEYQLLSLLNRSNREGLIKKFDLNEITASLAEDEAILEYGSFYHSNGLFNENNYFYNDIGLPPQGKFVCGKYYFVSIITRDKVDVCYLDFSESIDDAIEDLIEKLGNVDEYSDNIAYLCDKLLNPALALIPENVKNVYIVPDCNLYLLPFELLMPDALNLVAYLSTSRNIIEKRKEFEAESVSVFANPNFDLDKKDMFPLTKALRRDTGELLSAENINTLPWTEEEQKAIQELCSKNGIECSSFIGNQATKANFENSRSQLLHVATHAFAFEKSANHLEEQFLPFRSSQNPMKRSGLLLAGVSNILKGESLPEEYGDGIVTAHDILTMNLRKTSMVVLSACQTGLGNHLSGEGIQGFRKAFELSGVRYLICSLWEVEDFATMVFMKIFYHNLFEQEDLDVEKAFKLTKLEMPKKTRCQLLSLGIREDELDSRWDEDPDSIFLHPYWWAGFVLQKVGR